MSLPRYYEPVDDVFRRLRFERTNEMLGRWVSGLDPAIFHIREDRESGGFVLGISHAPDVEPSVTSRIGYDDIIVESEIKQIDATPGIDDATLLKRAVAGCRARRGRGAIARWIGVGDTFALGSTYSRDLCRRFGLDPDEKVKR